VLSSDDPSAVHRLLLLLAFHEGKARGDVLAMRD